jgi:hypothetical protein
MAKYAPGDGTSSRTWAEVCEEGGSAVVIVPGGRFIVVIALCVAVAACSTLEELGAQIEQRLDATKASVSTYVEREKTAAKLPANPCETVLSTNEERLYRLLMEYRGSKGLPPIPLSRSLSFVAKTHVRDLQAHPPAGNCNFHSWSDAGPWTACCYTGDHARAQCMWDKPRELTEYPGNGYEIASGSSGQNTAESALAGWQSSPLHNAVIVNTGTWARVKWGAVGIGIYGSYAVVWFGVEPDPCSN